VSRLCKVLGAIFAALGLVLLITFAVFAVRDEHFHKASMLKERNPGNVMYESEFFAAFTIHVFLVGGAIVGVLLALNGATMLVLGVTAGRTEAAQRVAPRIE
jgi:hypothetical protein